MWMIAKSNMKKKKGNVVILFFLIALSALLLYTGTNVLKNMGSFLDENYESQNGAHAAVITSNGFEEEVTSILKETYGYQAYEAEDCLITEDSDGKIKKNGSREKADTMSFMFLRMSQERRISDFEIRDKADTQKKNSIVVPMYLKVGKGYETGDEISIEFNGKKYIFEISGFIEDVMFANPSNVSLYKCYLTDEMYEELEEKESALAAEEMYNIQLNDVSKATEYEDAITKRFSEITDPEFELLMGVNYPIMRGGTSMLVNILMAILAVFSILIVVIAIVVMRFSVVSNMEENLPNIGILKAAGYTSGQLARATVLEYVSIAVVGIGTGLAFAGGSSNAVAGIISGSVGLVWKTKLDGVALVLTVALIVILILAAVCMTSWKYRKISTLDALRDGIETHSFKHNYLPLHKSVFKVNTSLGLKGMLRSKKQNVSMILIVALLSFATVVMLMVSYNFVFDNKSLIDIVGIEKPNIQMAVPAEQLEETKAELEKDAEAKTVISSGMLNFTIKNQDKETVVTGDIYDDTSQLAVDTLLEGRRPKQDNEVNITNVIAKTVNAELGDSIILKLGDVEENFVVVGITQQIANMGKSMLMEEKAVKRLLPAYESSRLYIYLKDSEKAEAKTKEWKARYQENKDILVTNFDETYNTILGTFTMALGALCVVLVVITIAVVSLVVFLLSRMKLIRERKMLGVYKAVGYTTPQLMLQTIMSFIPVVGFGVLVGSIVAALSVNSVFALCLSASGIENCHMKISIWIIAATFMAITLMALAVVTFSSWKIRKIEPYKMITE